jgi:hypothetical protein
MSAASRTDQPPEGTVSSDNASRRTFLKGVVLGASAPGAWSPPSPTPGWAAEVPGALGCRSYRDNVLTTATDVQNLNGFPGEQGSKVVASIKPNPNVLLNPSDQNYQGLVQALYDLILDGATKANTGYFAGTPQLTVWFFGGPG